MDDDGVAIVLNWVFEAEVVFEVDQVDGVLLLLFCVNSGYGPGGDLWFICSFFGINFGGDVAPGIVVLILPDLDFLE